jgi:hypothetical protein
MLHVSSGSLFVPGAIPPHPSRIIQRLTDCSQQHNSQVQSSIQDRRSSGMRNPNRALPDNATAWISAAAKTAVGGLAMPVTARPPRVSSLVRTARTNYSAAVHAASFNFCRNPSKRSITGRIAKSGGSISPIKASCDAPFPEKAGRHSTASRSSISTVLKSFAVCSISTVSRDSPASVAFPPRQWQRHHNQSIRLFRQSRRDKYPFRPLSDSTV